MTVKDFNKLIVGHCVRMQQQLMLSTMQNLHKTVPTMIVCCTKHHVKESRSNSDRVSNELEELRRVNDKLKSIVSEHHAAFLG